MKNKFKEQYFEVGNVVEVANGTYYLITKIELPDGYGKIFKYINLVNGEFQQIPEYNKNGLSRDITSAGLDIDKIYDSWNCEHVIFKNDQFLIAEHMQNAENYEEKLYQREMLRQSLNKLDDEINDLYNKFSREE